jgi:transposase
LVEVALERLRMPHFYKTLGILWREKQRIEQHLYRRGLDLFNQEVDLVFFDTTSTYFEGTTWEGWAKRGMSRDHRPDHLQLIVGVVMRRDGIPISC